MLEQLQSIQNALQMYEEMKQMMELFQGMEAENPARDTDNTEDPGPGGGFDPMSMLSGMLTPEQMEMFRMFQSDFGSTAANEPPEKEN